MKERPILFRPALVRAILNGQKTQTRRVMRGGTPAGHGRSDGHWQFPGTDKEGPLVLTFAELAAEFRCPYGVPGDRLWVRERWHHGDYPGAYCYAADKVDDEELGCTKPDAKWKPSIHMPRAACRLVLEVTDVRAQRLQDTSAQDAVAEGTHLERTWEEANAGELAPSLFRKSWDRINSPRGFGWDANPWVWAITFRRVSS